jgi:hypothetical protein
MLALKRALAYQALTHAVMDSARPETRPETVAAERKRVTSSG